MTMRHLDVAEDTTFVPKHRKTLSYGGGKVTAAGENTPARRLRSPFSHSQSLEKLTVPEVVISEIESSITACPTRPIFAARSADPIGYASPAANQSSLKAKRSTELRLDLSKITNAVIERGSRTAPSTPRLFDELGEGRDGIIRFGRMLVKRPNQFHAILLTRSEENLKNLWFAIQASAQWTSAFARTSEEVMRSAELAAHAVVFVDLSFGQEEDARLLCEAFREQDLGDRIPIIGVMPCEEYWETEQLFLLDAGVSRIVPDAAISSVTRAKNFLREVERHDIQNSKLLRALQGALHAMDLCETAIAVMDSQQTIQFVSKAYEQLIGSSERNLANASQDLTLTGSSFANSVQHQLSLFMRGPSDYLSAVVNPSNWSHYTFKHANESPELQQTIKILKPLVNDQTNFEENKSRINATLNDDLLSPPAKQLAPSDETEDPVSLAFYEYYVAPLEQRQIRESVEDFVTARELMEDQACPQTQSWREDLVDDTHSDTAEEMIESATTWSFDLVRLSACLRPKQVLRVLGLEVFRQFRVSRILKLDDCDKLSRWFNLIASAYADVPYHNQEHAADVLQAVAYLLESQAVYSVLDPLDQAACLIGAVFHDIGHPGRNNAYLVNTMDTLAIQYNDQSVLENFHSSSGLRLTIESEEANIFANLSNAEFRQIRQSIIGVILATDMAYHFQTLQRFETALPKLKDGTFRTPYTLPYVGSLTPKVELMKTIVKAADISNPCRSWRLSKIWAERITEEFIGQCADEESKGIPPFIKGKVQLGNGQVYFAKTFVMDIFCKLGEFIPRIQNKDGPFENLKTNTRLWSKYDEAREKEVAENVTAC